MTDTRSIRVGVRREFVELGDVETVTRYRWVLEATAPVRALTVGATLCESRAAALADFQEVCAVLGWTNDVTEVPVR